MSSDEEDEQDSALSCDLVFKTQLPNVLPTPVGSSKQAAQPVAGFASGKQRARPVPTTITSTAWSSAQQRLYIGLSNGVLCFWSLEQRGAGQLKFVGEHKGSVTSLCLPKQSDGELGACKLILSGSADMTIKIWDFQGKVGSKPTVCVQTLYGHGGTITGLFTYDSYIISSSTDQTVKVWKAVEGRGQLVYPWYVLQATPLSLNSWVRSMSYDKSREVGDQGTFFAVDEAGSMIRMTATTLCAQDERCNKGSACNNNSDSQINASSNMSGDLPYAFPTTHDRGVLHVRYVADWHVVLTICYDNCLRVFDSNSGDCKHCWENESGCLFLDLEVQLETDEVLAVDQQGVLSVFSLKAGRLLATKRVAQTPIVKIRAVLGRHTYAIMTERELSVWHLNHALPYNLLRGGHTKPVISLYACTGGTGAKPAEKDYRIFSAGLDNTLRLWDPYDLACIRVHEESENEITAMTFYEAWNTLVTGHDNGDIRLWDPDTGLWFTLKQHTNSVSCLVMAMVKKNEELLISGGYDGQVILWDIRTLRNEPPHVVARFKTGGYDPQRILGSCEALDDVSVSHQSLTYDPTSSHASSCLTGAGASESVFPNTSETSGKSTGTGYNTRHITARKTDGSSVHVSNNEHSFVGSIDSTASQFYDSRRVQEATVVPRSPLPLPGFSLDALALEPEILVIRFDPLKKVIITGGNDRVIKVWNMSGHMQLGQHRGHTAAITSMALDVNLLFSGSDDCTIRVWDTVPNQDTATASAFLPQHRMSVAGMQAPTTTSSSQTYGLNFFVTKALHVLTGHTATVTALEVSPHLGLLLSCSLDGSLRMWDYTEGVTLAKFTHHEEMRCMAVRSNKQEVLIGTQQANILRYSLQDVPGLTPANEFIGNFAANDLLDSADIDSHDVDTEPRPVVDAETGSKPSTPVSTSSHSKVATSELAGRSVGISTNKRSSASTSECLSSRSTQAETIPAGIGRVFDGVAGAASDPWRWGAAKVQLKPAGASKLTADGMLAALDKQRMSLERSTRSPGQLKH